MKALKIFLWCLPVYCVLGSLSSILERNRDKHGQLPDEVYYVSGLLQDWNKKHEGEVSDVAILSYGEPSDLLDDIYKAIPDENVVFAPNRKECLILKKTRAAAFMIIIFTELEIDVVHKYYRLFRVVTDFTSLLVTANAERGILLLCHYHLLVRVNKVHPSAKQQAAWRINYQHSHICCKNTSD